MDSQLNPFSHNVVAAPTLEDTLPPIFYVGVYVFVFLGLLKPVIAMIIL